MVRKRLWVIKETVRVCGGRTVDKEVVDDGSDLCGGLGRERRAGGRGRGLERGY